MKIAKKLFCLSVIFLSYQTYGQVKISSINYDSLLTASDSLSIFDLLDSLISSGELAKPKSVLSIRAGYNSNITSAGRPFQVNQFGLSAGSSFYHRSGIFADVTGYWSNQYDPSYFLTVTSIGYMNTTLKKWSFIADYSHSFYNVADVSAIPYSDNIMAGIIFSDHNFYARCDYYLFFGGKTGHRLIPSVTYNFNKKNWRGIKKISFYPSFSILFGNEEVQYYEKLFSNRLQAIYRIRHNLPLFREVNSRASGIMNYALVLPISILLKNWNFNFSYTYNIPKSLPHEEIDTSKEGFISFSLTRYLNFKKG